MNTVQPIRDVEKLGNIIRYLKGKNERDYIMFLVGIYTGLRISDILKLKVVDVRGSHIYLREKKTKKEKKVYINPELRRALKPYILNKEDHEFLFKSRNGDNKPLGRSAAYKMLRKVGDEFNITEIGTHTMRKTFGYHFYQSEKDVATLQDLFNHSNQKTTLRYIGVSQDAQDKKIKKFKYDF